MAIMSERNAQLRWRIEADLLRLAALTCTGTKLGVRYRVLARIHGSTHHGSDRVSSHLLPLLSLAAADAAAADDEEDGQQHQGAPHGDHDHAAGEAALAGPVAVEEAVVHDDTAPSTRGVNGAIWFSC